MRLDVLDDPDTTLVDELSERLFEHNCRVTGTRDFRKFAIVARDADGTSQGGASGWTRWGWLFLDILFVEDAHRGRGLGSDLLREVEALGIRRGCTLATLETGSFQAPDFYRRHGYEEMFALDLPQLGIRKLHFRKALVASD